VVASSTDESESGAVRMDFDRLRDWMNHYGRFYRSKCVQVLRRLNEALARRAQRKFKRFSLRTTPLRWRLARAFYIR
jgi:hypothetical protein